jgi:serine/threonine protein kinase/tetratricopeptide (TPR) repeat protein
MNAKTIAGVPWQHKRRAIIPFYSPPKGRMPSEADRPPTPSDPRRSDELGGTSSTARSDPEARKARASALREDELVAERYRVIRVIGSGGMGEVYEVEDRSLGGAVVALKTIRPEAAVQPLVVERFKREIYLARKITHPNVCRIYDLGSHRPIDGSGEMLFFTMELLSGQTLADRIVRSGRLEVEEALPILRQLASGLDAAHAQGIIHRDFKSANIILVKGGASGSLTRAVITDFGLASVADGVAHTLASISDGKIVGTPAYMAPEQISGLPLTTRADLYAFGIVAYEMVTGKRPFEGGSPISVATRRILQPPDPPSKHAPDLDPVWDVALLKCLEREPAARFASAGDCFRALIQDAARTPGPLSVTDAGSMTATMDVLPPSRFHVSRTHLVLSLALIAVGVAGWMGYRTFNESRTALSRSSSPPASPSSPVALRPAVAIFGIKNLTGQGDVDWLGTAIAEMLTTDLTAGGKLRSIPGPEIARIKRDLDVADIEGASREVLSRLRDNLHSDFLISGGYTLRNGLLRLDLRLVDLASGDTAATGSAHGTEAQLFDLLSRAAEPLCQRLGVGSALQAAEAARDAQASMPSNREAARAYAEGLSKWRLLDVLGARQALERAVAADPAHPLSHSALSAAWSALGYDLKATEEARKALGLAGRLRPEEKLSIEARFHEASKDWPAATASYKALLELAPDDVEYGLGLASVQIRSGRARDALLTLESMRRLPGNLSDDPRIDLTTAQAYQELGDLPRQRSSAAQAAARGTARGARSITARANLVEAAALADSGEGAQASVLAEEARQRFEAAGDRSGAAKAVERIALTLYTQGDLDAARKLFARSLAVYRESGDRSGEARVLHNTGNVLLAQGHLQEAQAAFDQSLATFGQIGAKYEKAAVLNDMGARLQSAGDLPGARKRYEAALALFGEIGEKKGVATTLTNLAEVLYVQGDLAHAQDLHEEALAACREIGEKDVAGYNLFRLGEIFAAKGDLNVAKQRYEEALKVQGQLGDKVAIAQTRLGLAAVARAQSHLGDAEALGREAEEALRTANAEDLAALAQCFLAETLLDEGKAGEAQKMSDLSAKTSTRTEDRHVRFSVVRAGARLRASSGRPEDVTAAARALEEARAEAAAVGFVGDELETILAQANVDARAGRRAEARTRLASLARRAEQKEYGLLARRAEDGLQFLN